MTERKIEIKLLVPEEDFKFITETVSFDDIPFGKREKALRLLKRSLRSMIDNNANYIKWSNIDDQIGLKRDEQRECNYKIDRLKNEIYKLKELSHNYSIEVTSQVQKLEIQIGLLNSKYEQLEPEINELYAQLPEFMKSGRHWWWYR